MEDDCTCDDCTWVAETLRRHYLDTLRLTAYGGRMTEKRRVHVYRGVDHPQFVEKWLQELPGRLVAVLPGDADTSIKAVTVEDGDDGD